MEDMKEEKRQSGFWKGFFSATAFFVIIGAVFLTGNLLIQEKAKKSNVAENEALVTQDEGVLQKLALLETIIREYSLEELDDQQLEDYLYYGLVAGIGDKYAAYYTKEELENMMDSSSGSYGGIGAVFSQDLSSGEITVSQLYEGYPAYRAGLLPQDILYKVDGEEVTGQDLSVVVTKIKGEVGKEVTLSVLRGEEMLDFTMKCEIIEVQTVEHEMLEGQTGYIRITEFDGITTTQFEDALTDLQKKGMESLIIDLRNNGGGSVEAVTEIADKLLPEGTIVSIDYHYKEKEERTSDSDCIKLPMAVLINGYSASASEILAGALQDYGVATIVGTTSYGKGIVQNTLSLNDGTAIKLTVAKYYTPNGNDIHEIGITPDVEIDLPEELKTQLDISYEEDVQLQKAIEVLQQ